MNTLLTPLIRRAEALTTPWITVWALLGVLLVGAVDLLTGHMLSMSLFYIGPVAMAAWFGGSRVGFAIAVVGTLTWLGADLLAGGSYSHPLIPVWNAMIRLGIFAIIAWLVSRQCALLSEQQDLARTDPLTGLFGRRAFGERLAHDLARSQRTRGPLTVAYMDLDDFKAINDRQGHAEGDRVLTITGRVLSESLRGSDTAARLGGDEFALVLPDTDSLGAHQFMGILTRTLHDTWQEHGVNVGCSIGAVTILDASLSVDSVLGSADALMYEVKRSGKGEAAFRELGGIEPVVDPAATRRSIFS